MIVHLTEKGKQIKQPEPDYQKIFDYLLPEELQQLSQYLERMIESFQMQNGAASAENDKTDWMSQARERMGNEHFEQLLAFRRTCLKSYMAHLPKKKGCSRHLLITHL